MTEENMNITVTFPSNVPSGTRLGYKRATSPSSPYTYISSSQVIDVPISTDINFILELPSGYTFKKWTMTGGSYRGEYTEVTNPTVYRFSSGPATVTFEFTKDSETFTTKISVESPGQYSKVYVDLLGRRDTVTSSHQYTEAKNTPFSLTAEAGHGCEFWKWRCYTSSTQYFEIEGTDWMDTFFGDRNIIEYRGIFKEEVDYTPVELHISSSATGSTVQYKIDSGSYQSITHGTTVQVPEGHTISFRPNSIPEGKEFNYWTKDGTIVEPRVSELTFTATGTTKIIVELFLKNSTVTHTVNVHFDTTALGHCKIYYKIGSQSTEMITDDVTLSIDNRVNLTLIVQDLQSGYYVKKWSIEEQGSTTDIPETSTITHNIRYDATITLYLKRKFRITVEQSTGGTISPGTIDLDEHSEQKFTITPDRYYSIGAVIVDGQSQGSIPSYTFVDVTASHIITAQFVEEAKCTVVASADVGGRIEPSGTSYIHLNESKQYIITADKGYEIKDVIVDGVSEGRIQSKTLTYRQQGHTIHATFNRLPDKFKITVKSTGHGTIVASATEVSEGDSVVITSTPDTDWYLDNIIDNGESKGAKSPYTIVNIDRDHVVTAVFEHSATIRTLMYVKVDGAWHIINVELAPKMYVKINGTWQPLYTEFDAPAIYEKIDGKWVKLFQELNNLIL